MCVLFTCPLFVAERIEKKKRKEQAIYLFCFSVHVTFAVLLTIGSLCQHCLAFCGSSSSMMLNVHRDHRDDDDHKVY